MTSWLRRVKARFKYRNFERDIAEELEVHRSSMRDAAQSGSNEPDGGRAAAVAFGNATLAMEEARMIWTPRAVWQLKTDIRWAWRGLRARRWRGPFMIVMLAFALAANTLLFAAADSLLFKPVPYGRADRLVTLNLDHGDPSAAQPLILTPGLLDDLRRRTDLFAAAHGHISGSYTFIMDASSPQREPTTFVTPGLIEMLGISPAAGRGLTVDDAGQIDVRAALIAASLAIERFGSARAAVGQVLQTAEEPLQIVGVMPRSFQFPDALARIWRPLDYRLVTQGRFLSIAELAPGVPTVAVRDALTGLSTAMSPRPQLSGGPESATARISAAPFNQPAAASRPLLLTLLSAALCLLLIVCVNLANLEVASMVQRARLSAIQLALGATPARLRRAAFIEGAALVLVALALAAGGIGLVYDTVALWLPARMTRWSLNPIDFDLRAWTFLAGCAALCWLAVTLPMAVQMRRREVTQALKDAAPQVMASRRIARLRGGLTAVEIGLAIVLIVGCVLYARTYRALIGLDKGFESSHLVGIDLTMPTSVYSVPGATTVLLNRVLETLEGRPDVRSVTRVRGSVFDPGTTIRSRIEVDGRPPAPVPVSLALRTADASFFETFGLEPIRGRLIGSGEAPTNIVITPGLANALWSGTDPIGRTIRTAPDQPWLTIIGVVNHIRYVSELPGDRYGDFFEVYVPPPPPVQTPAAKSLTHISETSKPAETTRAGNIPRSGAIFMFLSFAARLDPNANLADILRDLRAIDSRFALRVQPIDAVYAETYRDRLLAVRAVGVFALLSCAAAVAGLFAVLSFIVATRRREIGIRLALGATPGRIRTQFLRSAGGLVLVGGAAGLAVAFGLAHWLRAQFYGVAPADPFTYSLAAVVVGFAALVAAWLPARAAASVDPALTLRQE